MTKSTSRGRRGEEDSVSVAGRYRDGLRGVGVNYKHPPIERSLQGRSFECKKGEKRGSKIGSVSYTRADKKLQAGATVPSQRTSY